MKIAFVGKGGSGKTTLASLFVRHVACQGRPVMAIDADINQHLAAALGMDEELAAKLPALGDHFTQIKDYLRGDNPNITSAETMLKTTPPGPGSRLLSVTENNSLYEELFTSINGVQLAVTGAFNDEDLGVACYHSKVGAVELMLNHMIDVENEYVVVDMVAGAEAFASSMFAKFDVVFLVCEPTLRSLGVYNQFVDYAADYDVNIRVIGNKIDDDDDIAFLQQPVGDALVAHVNRSKFIKATERGQHQDISMLEEQNIKALDAAMEVVDKIEKDWPKFTRQAHQFHRSNAEAWGNSRTGQDLTAQINPDFVLGPDQLISQK